MHQITFEIVRQHEFQSGHAVTTVDIRIDGRPLVDLIRDVELPMAVKEGHPKLAGAYQALTIATSSLERHFKGKDKSDGDASKGKTILLVCVCGVQGCWPLFCKIRVQDRTVTWSDFVQPHRDEDWDYSGFTGFVFDKEQYMNAVAALSRSSDEDRGIGNVH